jgi:hypothetical protein
VRLLGVRCPLCIGLVIPACVGSWFNCPLGFRFGRFTNMAQTMTKKTFVPKTLDTQKLGKLLEGAGVKRSSPKPVIKRDLGHELGFKILVRMAELWGEDGQPDKSVNASHLKKGLSDLAIGFINQINPGQDVPFQAVCDVTGHKPSPFRSHELKGKSYSILAESDMVRCQEILNDVFPAEYRKVFGEAVEAVADAAKSPVIG